MVRFELEEEVIVKVRGEVRGRGKITYCYPEGRLYKLMLDVPDESNIMALDNKHCCKYGFGSNSYQIYKLEEA